MGMLTRIRLFLTLRIVAHQASWPWDFPGKNMRVACHFLLQGIFPTQGWNPHLSHLLQWQVDSLPLCQPGSGTTWVQIPALQMDKLGLEKAEEPEIKLPTSR